MVTIVVAHGLWRSEKSIRFTAVRSVQPCPPGEIRGLRDHRLKNPAQDHVVSERLIERIDEMLGRPAVDPHGDPIPTADGHVPRYPSDTLLTCPIHQRVVVTRVTDQDAAFLRFIEQHHLMPGETIEVEARDEVADSVRLLGRDDQRITIGMRAASKVRVSTTVARSRG